MSKTIGKSFGILTVITIIEKLLSFVYQTQIAAILGASITTDSYFAASQLITFVDTTLFTGLTVALLKVYSTRRNDLGQEQANSFLSESLSWTLMLSFAIWMLLLFLSKPISIIIAPGFASKGRKTLIRDIRILSIIPVFSGLIAVCSSLLRYERDFIFVALKSLMLSIFGMIVLQIINVSAAKETISLAYGQVMAMLIYSGILLYRTKQFGRLRLEKIHWNPDHKQLLMLLIPLIVSNGITRVSMMVDRIIASNVGEGAVSFITYSHTLYDVVHTLLIANLCLILLSDFTVLAAKNKTNELKEKISDAITVLIYILSFVTIISIVYHYEIVDIIYGRGHFSKASVLSTGNLLMYYAVCFPFSAINNVYIQAFYALGKTQYTMYISLLSVCINILTSILISRMIGLNGIAIGTIIATLLMCAIYACLIRKLLPDYKGLLHGDSLLHILIISVICVIIACFCRHAIKNTLLSFMTASFLSALLSFGSMLLIKDRYTLKIKNTALFYITKRRDF